MTTNPEENTIENICRQAKLASRTLAHASTEQKNAALGKIADQLWQERDKILTANQEDIEHAKSNGMSDSLLDRLTLDENRLASIIEDFRSVISLPDLIGEQFDCHEMPNGLKIHKQRVPLGVIGVIYEARPNVTVDVVGLTLKSGNCVILRGGSETIQSNLALVGAIQRGLIGTAIPPLAIQLISDVDRNLVLELLKMDAYIDMIIPRGGAGLHEFCRQNSRIPVITGGIGICHLFVDESANFESSIEVIRNAKIQRPSVCNALDTVLVHQSIADMFCPQLVTRLSNDGVTFRADDHASQILQKLSDKSVLPAGEMDFDTEWLSLVLGVKIVDGLDNAMEHILAHSTGHSDGILTENKENAKRFLENVDSAAVYVNASTRFTDGSQMGLGAEIAISTQRLHARGPMGLKELTTYKWVVQGDYTVRS